MKLFRVELSTMTRLLVLTTLLLALVYTVRHGAEAQVPKGTVSANDSPPPVRFNGLIPGRSNAAEVRAALGEPLHEASWYSWKMLYRSARPGLLDSVQLEGGRNGRVGCIEAASIPAGYETTARVRLKLGEPEYELRMKTFSMLDYAAKGVRLVFDAKGATIGVAYFPHLKSRVHDGGRKLMDLGKPSPSIDSSGTTNLSDLRVGTAEIKLTPLSPDWLAPQYRAKFKLHDDLWARCALFAQGNTAVAFVGADLFVMSYVDIAPIIERLARDGIQLILAQSHNHAAPDDVGVYGHYPAEHVKYVQEQIVQCVLAARAHLQPVKELRAASRELPMDGARVQGLIRNARNPGLVDPTLNLIQAIGRDGKPITTLVNFACHVEGLETGVVEMSADFPGYMCEQIRADGGGQAVFLNGAVGGMVSGDTRARTHEEARVCGLEWARLVRQLAATARPARGGGLAFQSRRVEIPLTNPRFQAFAKLRGTRLVRGRMVTTMAHIRLGGAEFITVPGELLPEVSFEILERMTGFPRMIVGLANDEIGYIIPTSDYRDDEYEETMSLGPAAAPTILDTALRMIGGVR